MSFNLTTTSNSSTNRHRVNLYDRSSDGTLIQKASLTQNPPHPERTWTFTDLIPGKNYRYEWIEIDSNDQTLQTYASQNFTTLSGGSTKIKLPKEVIADFTPGITSGASSFTMDGATGKDDWRGWDIHLEKIGFGTQFTEENYTYNKDTGILTLTDQLSPFEKLYIEFIPQIVTSAAVAGSSAFTGVRLITASGAILASDFGTNKILVKGATNFINLTLPAINTIPEFLLLHIETGRGSHKSVTITSTTPSAIDWLEGARTKLYMGICESLIIYRYGNEIRVDSSDGNFKTVGEIISDDAVANKVYNKTELNGAILSNQDYARLYYDYVLNLPAEQTISFDNWYITPQRYSLANNIGQFHVPDRMNLFERAVDAAGERYPGYYQPATVGPHIHPYLTGDKPGISDNANDRNVMVPISGESEMAKYTDTNSGAGSGTETKPENYSTRRYVRT